MASQAVQFALSFERLGRRMLAQLEGLPEGLWDRAPLSFCGETLFALATRFLEESAYWVLVVVGGHPLGGEHSGEASAPEGRARMLQSYECWAAEMHRVLGRLPDAVMNLFVALPPARRATFGGESITVRACLLYALEQSGLLLGRIEVLALLVTEGGHLLHEGLAPCELGRRVDLHERDTRVGDGIGSLRCPCFSLAQLFEPGERSGFISRRRPPTGRPL